MSGKQQKPEAPASRSRTAVVGTVHLVPTNDEWKPATNRSIAWDSNIPIPPPLFSDSSSPVERRPAPQPVFPPTNAPTTRTGPLLPEAFDAPPPPVTSPLVQSPAVYPPTNAPEPTALREANPHPAGVSMQQPNFDAFGEVYRQAGIWWVPFPAEEAVDVLTNLPYGLSPETKFVRMKERLAELPMEQSVVATQILGDAAEKMVALRKHLSVMASRHASEQSLDQKKMLYHEAEAARMRQQMAQRNEEYQKKHDLALLRIDEFTGVIVFFDAFQAFLARQQELATSAAEEEAVAEVTPPFADEETILKLIRANARLAPS